MPKEPLTAFPIHPFPVMEPMEKLYPRLTEYCNEAALHFDAIEATRQLFLRKLAGYILERLEAEKPLKLTFICTHNSRRSHMAQLWAIAAAGYYGIKGISCFSGGTEATAFNPRAVSAMERAGFRISGAGRKDNPAYEASWSPDVQGIPMFSKTYDHPVNPTSDFAAVMVCSEAERNCPFVPGAEKRIAIPYEDPKAFDDTPSETAMYDERCRQIAIEMLCTMQLVREKLVQAK